MGGFRTLIARHDAASYRQHKYIALALLVTWLSFGSTFLAIKEALRDFPPLLVASINLVGAGIVLFVWQWPQQREKLGWDQWRPALLLGTLLFFLGRGSLIWGTQFLSSGNAALLFAAAPAWVALLGYVFFHERLSPRAVLGLATGFGGLLLLIAPSGEEARLSSLGVVMLTASAVSWAAGSLLARRVQTTVRPLVSTAMQMLVGGTLMTLASSAAGEWGHLHAATLTSIAAVVYLTIVVALVGFTTFSWLLRMSSTVLANSFSFVSPAVAVLLGWAMLHEPLTGRTVAACAVILIGVALIGTAAPAGNRTNDALTAKTEP